MKILNCLLFCLVSISMGAQISDSLNIDISEVVISENRISIPFSDVSRNIEIIQRDEIEALNPVSINEVLQVIGGIDLRQRGVHGVQADLSIRGGTFEQALVLINGVKMLDPQTGHHMMNLPITVEDIERIEVLKGPGARVFGQNAFAGAINIITKTSSSSKTTAGFQYGENGLINTFISSDLPVGNYQQKISASYDHSDGYRFNTDYDIYNIFYQGQAAIGKNRLNILGGFTSRDFGANSFYGNETFVDQFERTRTSVLSADLEARSGDWKFQPRFSWRRNFDNWRFRREDPDFFQNIHTSHVVTGEFNSSKTHKAGILGLGVEYNNIQLNSSNLGDHNRNQIGLHAENRFLINDDRFDITPGIYFLHISDYGLQIFPGLDLGYTVNNKVKLFANAGFTSRIPSFTDLYYEDRGNVGNPNLEDESAFTFELGTKIKHSNSLWQISFFRRNASDLIDWFKENPDDKWMPDNFGSASYTGLDLSTTIQSRTFVKYLRINYLYLNASIDDNNFSLSRNALENLRHQIVVNPQFEISSQFSGSLVAKYNDRVSLEDYMVVDANLNYKIQNVTLSLRASNLFDTEFRETNLVPMPGRWISGGLRIQFD